MAMLAGSQFESNLCYWFESILGPVVSLAQTLLATIFNRSTTDLSLDDVTKNNIEIIVPFLIVGNSSKG